jgi:NADPH2 dehydrogenase
MIKPGIFLKNRLVVPPMASQTADEDGYVTKATLDHYDRLTESRAGLVFVEYSYVDRQGRSEPNQLGIDHGDKIDGLTTLAEVIKSRGATAAMQITHAGGKTKKEYSGRLVGAGNLPVPTIRGDLGAPIPLPLSDVKAFQRSFVEAAKRAFLAGFDMVEIHCAHGYGINQWLSPLTNNRTDAYGGNLENRMRMLLDIVRMIRTEIPDLPLAVRVPGQDFLPGGLSQNDMVAIVRRLEELEISLINVSSGLGGWQRPKERTGQGYLFDEASYIHEHIGVPVIGVGGVTEPTFIDETLGQDRMNLIAVGREILKGPGEFGERFYESDVAGLPALPIEQLE